MKKYLFIVLFVGVWSCSRDTKTSDFNNDVKIENNHYKKSTIESYEIFREKFGDSTINKRSTDVRIFDEYGKLIKEIDSIFYDYSNALELSITTRYYDNGKRLRKTVHDFEKNILEDIIYEYNADSILINKMDTLNDKVLEYKQFSDSGKLLSHKLYFQDKYYHYDKNDSLIAIITLEDGIDTLDIVQYEYTDNGKNLFYFKYDSKDHKIENKYKYVYDKRNRELEFLSINVKDPDRSGLYKYTPYKHADKYTEEAYNEEGKHLYRRKHTIQRGVKVKVDYSKEITYYDERIDSTIFIRDSTPGFSNCCYQYYENGEIWMKEYVTKSEFGSVKYEYTFATFSSGERENSLNKTEIFYDDRGNILKIKKSRKDFSEKNIIPKELEVRRYNENNDIILNAYYKYDPKFGGKFMKDRYYIFKYEY